MLHDRGGRHLADARNASSAVASAVLMLMSGPSDPGPPTDPRHGAAPMPPTTSPSRTRDDDLLAVGEHRREVQRRKHRVLARPAGLLDRIDHPRRPAGTRRRPDGRTCPVTSTNTGTPAAADGRGRDPTPPARSEPSAIGVEPARRRRRGRHLRHRDGLRQRAQVPHGRARDARHDDDGSARRARRVTTCRCGLGTTCGRPYPPASSPAVTTLTFVM